MKSPFALTEVSVSLSPLERFEEYLQSRGMRITRERRAIVDEIYSRHEHFDADELLARLQQSQSEIPVSRPTVYRTLEVLVEAGLLKKMTLAGRAVYEHDYGYPQHDHMYCERCGKLIEFSHNQIKELCQAAAREHQFRVTGHRLIVSGICAACAAPRPKPRPLDLGL